MANSIVQTLQIILNMSEVWATLIPLLYLLFDKVDYNKLKEIIIFLWIALILNLIIVIIAFLADFYTPEEQKSFPFLLKNNTIEYNLLSVLRVSFFILYFIRNSQDLLRLQKKLILYFFWIFVVINFTFFESALLQFSSRLFTAEAIVLLFFCVFYFLSTINQEKSEKLSAQPIFWIVTGLSIYESVNFFIFLLFKYLATNYTFLAQNIWNIHNISYILLCIFITKAFHASRHK